MLIGALMLPFPPPFAFGIIILPAGLLILSTEFEFARRWLHFIKTRTGPLGRGIQAAESRAARLAKRVLRRSDTDSA